MKRQERVREGSPPLNDFPHAPHILGLARAFIAENLGCYPDLLYGWQESISGIITTASQIYLDRKPKSEARARN